MSYPPPNRNHNPTLAITLNVTQRGLDYHQNLTVSSVARLPPFHRIFWKSVNYFLRNPANRQTHKLSK